MHNQDIVTFLKQCHQRGWMPGTAGGLAHLVSMGNNSKKILITPEGLPKDDLAASDMFALRDLYGTQELIAPISKNKDLSICSWAPLFIEILGRYPTTTCVGEFATKWTTLASRMAFKAWQKNADAFPNVLRLAYWGLIRHLNSNQELLIPIIETNVDVGVMQASLQQAISYYPNTCAVIIRNYGLIAWGDSIVDLKNKLEIIEHLCELQVTDFNLLK